MPIKRLLQKINKHPVDSSIERPASLTKLVWPIFIEQILAMTVGYVSQYMVTDYSENAVGAIGNANQITNLLLIMFTIINMSTTILVSQYIGSNNRHKLSIIYTLSILVNLVFSGFIIIIILLFADQIFAFMKVPEEILEDAVTYIKLVGGFIFLQGIIATFSAIFRSNRMMKQTMIISVFINIFNIAGNAVLINGMGPIPALGVAGSAIATDLSRLIGVILYIIVFIKKFDTKISLKVLRPFPKVELSKLLGIGLPSGGEAFSYSMAMTFILKIVNNFGKTIGPFVINTKVLSSTFSSFSNMYAVSVGQASQVVVGNYMGAGEIDKVDKRVMKTLFSSVAVAIFMSFTMFVFSDHLFGLFYPNDPRVLELGKKIMLVEVFLEIGKCTNVTLVRSLQATGDIKFPMMVGIGSMWIVAFGMAYFLGSVCNLGLVGVWIAMAMDEDLRAIIFFIRWKRGKWRNIRLV